MSLPKSVLGVVYMISAALEVGLLYLAARKTSNKGPVMGKLVVVMLASFAVSLVYDFVARIISSYAWSTIVAIFLETVIYVFLAKLLIKSKFDIFLSRKRNAMYSYILGYILFSLAIINDVDDLTSNLGSLLTIVLVVGQGIFALIIGLIYQRKYNADLKEQENKVLRFYTKQLEENQRALRKFKHDYQNILVSIEGAINDKDLLAEVNRYSAARLDDPKLWRFNNLDNVGDLELKSLLLTKINTIAHEKLKASFECVDKFAEIRGISKFDLIRIVGIAYDNAIEASKKLGAKAEIRAAIYQDEEGFSFEIRNRYADEVDLTQVTHSGYTTKVGHHGLGLANVKEICDGYSNVLFNTETGEGWFNFIVQVVV
ncbi:sensor histidine kinase [Ligilactobacillus agilis]|uniref:sensor histidine kinase n=1 Tax=Ligilactobacillus agilis TaxID=1601 RepID=UPI0015CCFA77|nr:GHKL domain-containing protein [Ligilactobacillus agilis]